MRKKRTFGVAKAGRVFFGGPNCLAVVDWNYNTITRVDVPKGEKVVANNKAKAKTSKSTTNTSERHR